MTKRAYDGFPPFLTKLAEPERRERVESSCHSGHLHGAAGTVKQMNYYARTAVELYRLPLAMDGQLRENAYKNRAQQAWETTAFQD